MIPKISTPTRIIKKQYITLFSLFLAALFAAATGPISSPVAADQAVFQKPEQDTTVYLPMIIGDSPSAESYDENFSEGIEPWAARRWSAGADYEIKHNDGCDDGRCGFLEMKINNNGAYVIASPIAAVDAPFTYKITTRAKLLDRDDGDAYGIIFGGDWTSNGCPGNDFTTCFSEYYEFRVRYRDDNGDKFLEWKLKRVEGHDENNQNFGPDIIDWKRLDGVNPDSWVKWDVEVHNNGQMHIFANNAQQAGSAKDTTYIHNHYFGLIGRTRDHDTHVLFDRVRIE